MTASFTGNRIRDLRQAQGTRQSDLAHKIGISPSYLNLIEHNRRRIGGKLLHAVAEALGVDGNMLTEAREDALITALRAAAALVPDLIESNRAAELVSRFPGWAGLIAGQGLQITALEQRVAALTDRLEHDATLTRSLHDVVMAVTAIHATATILVEDDQLDRDWQNRFHRNIHADSTRLAAASRRLIRHLEVPGVSDGADASPSEAVDDLLGAVGHHLADLEVPDAEVVKVALGLVTRTAAEAGVLRDRLGQYQRDALALPLTTFAECAAALNHDPALLADHFDQPAERILRRLASLPGGHSHPDFGLVVADATGHLSLRRSIGGLDRGSFGCPLWPVWQALTWPGRIVSTTVRLGDRTFACHAIAMPHGTSDVQVATATMLISNVNQTDPAMFIGPGCRTCRSTACAARREPADLLAAGQLPVLL